MAASSTRHILEHAPLDPPHAPFATGSQRPPPGSSPLSNGPRESPSNVSLSINYLPSKFSNPLMLGGARKRKGGKGIDPALPKHGGGVDAFKSGESRMPGRADEDDDASGWFGGGNTRHKKQWNKFKWAMFVANTLLTTYSLIALVFCLLTWFNIWTHADIVRVGNRPELIVSTIAASMGIVTSLIGWAGILLNNRSFLAIYTFLLWITFGFLVVPGYLSYKRSAFNLEGKVNAQWSRMLGADGRLRIQNELSCCGYFNPFVEATVSQTCYSRSLLPGCKLGYMNFERLVLTRWYIAAFALVPLHIAIMITGLLCSNHVTYRFGKGMMPKAYRLSMNSMAVIMDNYATQLADQYGTEVASDILARSRSNLQLDKMPPSKNAYETVGSRAPEGIS
ncbi:hypothetical protein BD779DRAFT_1438763 [Infundibulicybe gibba]|nr:hypothetical protein BD779DRAFT_1438763 [Infundibulicybe gibba]